MAIQLELHFDRQWLRARSKKFLDQRASHTIQTDRRTNFGIQMQSVPKVRKQKTRYVRVHSNYQDQGDVMRARDILGHTRHGCCEALTCKLDIYTELGKNPC